MSLTRQSIGQKMVYWTEDGWSIGQKMVYRTEDGRLWSDSITKDVKECLWSDSVRQCCYMPACACLCANNHVPSNSRSKRMQGKHSRLFRGKVKRNSSHYCWKNQRHTAVTWHDVLPSLSKPDRAIPWAPRFRKWQVQMHEWYVCLCVCVYVCT